MKHLLACFLCVALIGCQDKPNAKPETGLRVVTKPDDETKNRIWWEVEQSGDKVTFVYEEFAKFKEGATELATAMEDAEKIVLSGIGLKYGITYEKLKAIIEEGEAAAWRTETAPE